MLKFLHAYRRVSRSILRLVAAIRIDIKHHDKSASRKQRDAASFERFRKSARSQVDSIYCDDFIQLHAELQILKNISELRLEPARES